MEQYFIKLWDQVPSDFMPFSLLTLSYFVNARGVCMIATHSSDARTFHTYVDSDLSFHQGNLRVLKGRADILQQDS